MYRIVIRCLYITLLSMLAAVTLTGGSYLLLDLPNIAPAITMAIVCPVIIAPPITCYFFRQTERIEQLCGQLAQANLELADASARFEELSRRDGLTGLLNRATFFEASEIACLACGGSMLMIDADHFKSVNDRYGHEAGDRALMAIGRILLASAGDGAIAGRLGGEEFALFLPAANGMRATRLAETIRSRIEDTRLSGWRGGFTITVSIGIASAQRGVCAEALYRSADSRLLHAKRNGRNRSIQLRRPLAA